MKLRILLVDDEPLARERLRHALDDECDVEIISECGDGPSAVATIQNERPDIVFLDIRMPSMDGFQVLEALEPENVPWTIFVTAYDQHAVRAFEIHALDYLLKPTSKERIKEAIARARKRLFAAEPVPALLEWLAARENSRRIAVRNGDRVAFVPTLSVDWVEAAGNYALIHTDKQTHILRETLNELERRLPRECFLRVSRSAIINLQRVKELRVHGLDRWTAVLSEDRHVSVTRSRRELRNRLS